MAHPTDPTTPRGSLPRRPRPGQYGTVGLGARPNTPVRRFGGPTPPRGGDITPPGGPAPGGPAIPRGGDIGPPPSLQGLITAASSPTMLPPAYGTLMNSPMGPTTATLGTLGTGGTLPTPSPGGGVPPPGPPSPSGGLPGLPPPGGPRPPGRPRPWWW